MFIVRVPSAELPGRVPLLAGPVVGRARHQAIPATVLSSVPYILPSYMASSSKASMPPGRYSVDVGLSLGRALKARKGGQSSKSSRLPERDFYSFRYNFVPESVDPTKPGNIEIHRGKDSITKVSVERASTLTSDGGHLFVGQEQPAKEWECVLIFDEEQGKFTLEKLDSFVNLTYDRRTSQMQRPPVAIPGRAAADDLEAEIERSLLQDVKPPAPPERPQQTAPSGKAPVKRMTLAERTKAKAAQNATSTQAEPSAKSSQTTPRKAQEDDGGEEPPSAQVVSRPTKEKPPSKQPVSATSKPPGSSHPSLPLKPQIASPTTTKLTKPEKPTSTKRQRPADLQEVTDPRPPLSETPRPRKRAKTPPAPAPQKEFILELPGGPGVILPGDVPPSTTSLALPESSGIALPDPVLPVDSDEEEDWDDALVAAPSNDVNEPLPPPRAIEMEEIDPAATTTHRESISESQEQVDEDLANALEQELWGMDAGEDEDEDEFEQVVIASSSADVQPQSLNQYALEIGVEEDMSEYSSSSEDSDND
ncbi:hypothetical protein K474DRAFT_558789 [Panus rudis PR-1116 ss-1]|nr:hypothetical protein K474DRAFT_558789 [Panus rudis PR-1116 ss-1]